jgi:hypothetical protein
MAGSARASSGGCENLNVTNLETDSWSLLKNLPDQALKRVGGGKVQIGATGNQRKWVKSWSK